MKTFLIIVLLKFTLFQVKHGVSIPTFLTLQTTLEEQFYSHISDWKSFLTSHEQTERGRIEKITRIQANQENNKETLKFIMKEIVNLKWMIIGVYLFLVGIALRSKPYQLIGAIKDKLTNGKVV